MTEVHDTLIIRQAQLRDAEAIAHIRVAAWRAAYQGLMPPAYLDRTDLEDTQAEQLRDRLRNMRSEAHIIVAEVGGQIIGYCAYGRGADQGAGPSGGAVYDLYVHPDGWQRGIGRRLLAYATDHFKAQGFDEATLFVFEGNTRARKFYEHAGWKSDSDREVYEQADFSLPVLRYRMICC